MIDRFQNDCAPFIPKEAVFNEVADRHSEADTVAKPKNILAALMGNPAQEGEKPEYEKRLTFDEAHYNKF